MKFRRSFFYVIRKTQNWAFSRRSSAKMTKEMLKKA